MAPSLTGFIVGVIAALIVGIAGPALFTFAHAALIFGVIAVLLLLAFTFCWTGPELGRRRV